MNIFVYSDESGVFDKEHNDIYVFGGLIFLGKESRDIASRKYSHVEEVIRENNDYPKEMELKACLLNKKDKGSLFRSLNSTIKFCGIIKEKDVTRIDWNQKKNKQRFLDYAYKRSVKSALEHLLAEEVITPESVDNIYFRIDEHTTATNGIYELREGLEQELKIGTENYEHMEFFPPILPSLQNLDVKFCNSSCETLVRSADIVANRLNYLARTGQFETIDSISNMEVIYLP